MSAHTCRAASKHLFAGRRYLGASWKAAQQPTCLLAGVGPSGISASQASLTAVLSPAYEKLQLFRRWSGTENLKRWASPSRASASTAAPPLGRMSSPSMRATLSKASPVAARTSGSISGTSSSSSKAWVWLPPYAPDNCHKSSTAQASTSLHCTSACCKACMHLRTGGGCGGSATRRTSLRQTMQG